jgi:hypothetical protein
MGAVERLEHELGAARAEIARLARLTQPGKLALYADRFRARADVDRRLRREARGPGQPDRGPAARPAQGQRAHKRTLVGNNVTTMSRSDATRDAQRVAGMAKPQRLRKSTWDTPRFIRGYDITLDEKLLLPRAAAHRHPDRRTGAAMACSAGMRCEDWALRAVSYAVTSSGGAVFFGFSGGAMTWSGWSLARPR